MGYNSIMKTVYFICLSIIFFTASFDAKTIEKIETTTNGWNPDPCFPTCTTGPDQTSPAPERGCLKTDCFDEPLCQEMCAVINHCYSYEWILNNDDNDIFGETWCAVDGLGMCYCCDCGIMSTVSEKLFLALKVL